jgi:AcrR family transcriptional regulator
MSSRRYDMTSRSKAAKETRDRIVDAAIAVYARDGFKATSMQAIARAAEVSPATVLNHFAGPEALLGAAVEALSAKLAPPKLEDLASKATLDERVRWLLRELAAFYDRSSDWYAIYERDRELPILQKASAGFFRRSAALARAALGPRAADKHVVSVFRALAAPSTLAAFRATGMSAERAADTLADLFSSWLAAKERAR